MLLPHLYYANKYTLTRCLHSRQTEQKIDGKAIMMLAKRVSRDQFQACGLVTNSDQLKLAHVVSTAMGMDDSKLNRMVTAVVK